MKRILSLILVISVLLSTTCITFAASDYNSYRAEVDKLNAMDIKLQPQRHRIDNGSGLCNVVAATQLLNRRIAYDLGSAYNSNSNITLTSVITQCGNTVTKEEVKGKPKSYQVGYSYYGTDGTKGTTIPWYNYSYTMPNGYVYAIKRVTKSQIKGDFNEYLADLLMQHPEGVHYRTPAGSGGHCIVISDFYKKGNNYTFYAIDGTDIRDNKVEGNRKDGREEWTKTSTVWYNGATDLYKDMDYIAYIDIANSKAHTCPTTPKNSKGEWNYQTSGSKLGACKGCGKEFDWNSTKTTNEAGLYIAKSKKNIKLYNKPYEDATCKFNGISGELVIEGYVTNAYGSKWYITSGDDIGTVYIYEKNLKDIYTKNGNYYESPYHKYDSGNFIEDTSSSSSNQSSNNTSSKPQSSNNNTQTSSSQAQTITAPQQPTYVAPSLTLSTYSMAVNHVHESSRMITVNVSGTLPNGANLKVETTPGTTAEWGYCADGKAELTIFPNWKLREVNSTVTVSLRDSSNNVILQKQLVVSTNVEKYTVYFDTNGGYGGPSSIIGYYDDMIVIPFDCPSRDGYRFVGWSESRNATSASYDRQQGYYINKNTTLYAVWEDLFEGIENYTINLSDDELYLNYDSNRTETLLVVVDEDFANDYTVDFDCDNNIKWSLGDYWYNADGHMCREIIIEATKKDIKNNEATVYLKDELGKIRKEKSLDIYTEEESYNNRNKSGITVYLDGKKLDFDVQPSIINGRTMVPMRKIFEEIGAFVYWDNETQTAFGETIEDFVTIAIGDNYLEHNGEFVGLDSPATVISGRTLVPARAIAESFNCDVDWIGDLQVVTIESPKSKYNEDLIVGEWDAVAEIDDYTSFYPYDRAIATYEFNKEGGVYITYHDRDDMDYFFYDVTKGGFVIIYNQPKTMYMLGTIVEDEIYIQECNEYYGNELLRWGTVDGDTFIRRQFKNDKGVNYLEEDDGFVLERK